ncbi:hypothetical protein DRJ48_04385 [Candidatus Woesearchaeota archaeon]|nr:MAG: hypothetical protein DRJ48_04385 [Candidatus Woesearchaeota archaeon]
MEKEDEHNLDLSSEIEELKNEIKALRHQSSEGEEDKLENQLKDINDKLERLLKIFEKGVEYIKGDKESTEEEAGESEGVEASGSKEIMEKLNRILDDNALIAKGLIKLTSSVDGLNQRLDDIQLSIMNSLQRRLPIIRSSLASSQFATPPPPPRKETLNRYKQEFSK